MSRPLDPRDEVLTAGHLMTAESIVETYFRDAVTGARLVSPKWVKANVPGKVRLSHSKVFWYAKTVEQWLARRAA